MVVLRFAGLSSEELTEISEVKNLRQLLQRKFYFKVKLRIRLSVLRLIHVAYFERNESANCYCAQLARMFFVYSSSEKPGFSN